MILDLMKQDERCRNDDLWLCLQVWRKQGINIYVDYSQLKKMFNPETIIRNRAYIQNDQRMLLPTLPDVLIKRKVKEDVLREFYGERNAILQKYMIQKYDVK